MDGPAQFSEPIGRATIGDQLRRHARSRPDWTAVVYYGPGGDRVKTTYADLDRRSNQFARALQKLGVGRGDIVAGMSHASVDFLALYYGALKIGAAVTGVNFLAKADDVGYQLGHCEATLMMVEDTYCATVEEYRDQLGDVTLVASDVTGTTAPEGWPVLGELADVEPDDDVIEPVDELDLCMLIYTSGTEARPKGIEIPHRNYLISTTASWTTTLDVDWRDSWLFVMPFHTIAGLGGVTNLLAVGTTIVLPYAIDAGAALAMIAAEEVTVISQTPAFYLSLIRQDDFGPDAVKSVRSCLTYGGLLPAAMISAWHEVKPDVRWGTYWGQSELTQLGSSGWFNTLADIPGEDPTWIGRPTYHLEIRIVDEDGNDDDSGELICRSPSVMRGYHKDPERTAETLRGGWLHTGDRVRRDADGNLFFLDRVKDMIKTGGMNVSSQEVERALGRHDAVFVTAVVGLPDEYWSEAVTAFVITKPDAELTEAELIAHCKGLLSGYKVPKSIRFVDDLPRDPQGKILKRELRKSAT